MRSRNESARALLNPLLGRNPGSRAADLAPKAGVSTPTMLRMLKEAAASLVRIGKASQTRYYLRRGLRGFEGDIPVYAVDTAGQPQRCGTLQLLAPQGTFLDTVQMGWPTDAEFSLGVWPDGLPYPLQDMRPQGFLGRKLAQSESLNLAVPAHLGEWDDDTTLYYLLMRGADTVGNLILGDFALQQWMETKAQSPKTIGLDDVPVQYAALAHAANLRGPVGSSAAGEFPKFTAMRELAGASTPHVIVKYSGADASSTVQRWADLLICEHLALQTLHGMGPVEAAKSRIVQHAGRTFLEVERFDRVGLYGRKALCSLATLEASQLAGTSADWGHAGELLHRQKWLQSEGIEALTFIWEFGRMIGNTDMHKGNLSFMPGDPVGLKVAPVYDMLPMMYAPHAGGEVAQPDFTPTLPHPARTAIWKAAAKAAETFWQSASMDARISESFRTICKQNLAVVQQCLQSVG